MDGFGMVVAPEGQEKETLRLLLSLADKPRHVKIDFDDRGVYQVPDYLVQRYQEHTADSPEEAPEETPETPEETPAPKRRGRPPGSRNKTAPAADDKDGEE
jgi:hypothetical protein